VLKDAEGVFAEAGALFPENVFEEDGIVGGWDGGRFGGRMVGRWGGRSVGRRRRKNAGGAVIGPVETRADDVAVEGCEDVVVDGRGFRR